MSVNTRAAARPDRARIRIRQGSSSATMPANTIFTNLVAVHAWDTWFRWRDVSGVRDQSIESTWHRIAAACAASEGSEFERWKGQYLEAMSRWQLLPDERVLRSAGTGVPMQIGLSLGAALNVGCFVSDSYSRSPRLELGRLVQVAALAVRMLDGASMAEIRSRPTAEVRIGVIGMAEALHHLGLRYDSQESQDMAREVAIALSTGTLLGSVGLARDRGGEPLSTTQLERMQVRGTPAHLLDDALQWGTRYTHLTALDAHPRLALLANATCDALDPMPRQPSSVERRSSAMLEHSPSQSPPLESQLRLRAAMQPWIDALIDYPLTTEREPSRQEFESLAQLARNLGLSEPRVRQASRGDWPTGSA